MLVDELTIKAKAGRGGNGVVRWRHEKGKEYSGAAGGDGGRGGNFYVRGVRDIGAMARYRSRKEFAALRGDDGQSKSMHGKNGADFYLEVPIGSHITDSVTGREYEILEEGQEILLLQGGVGGFGNEHFKSSINTTPWEHRDGKQGEEGEFKVELNLIADAGLVGFPNAGKSSLLNAVTRAKAKVAAYEFTTLEPNLGELFGFILADIPGLIEGAARGKGLGHRFLRHIKRTKIILHCISAERDNLPEVYKVIREELRAFDPVLLQKPEYIVLTKVDLVDGEVVERRIAEAKELCPTVFSVSIFDASSLKVFQDELVKQLREL